MKKLLLVASTTLLIGAAPPISNTVVILEKDKQIAINALKSEIAANSYEEVKIEQINKNTKSSIDDDVKEMLKTNPIIQTETSSNPNKIIKEYEFETLDDNQIYDTNSENFQKIYSDAFGNATLDREQAAKSYVNAGNVRIKYSYDGDNWADSEGEAKVIQKRPSKVHKSLYYQYKGRYYNAFQPKETSELLRRILSSSVESSSKNGYNYYLQYIDNNNKAKHLSGPQEKIENELKLLLKKEIDSKNNMDFYKKITSDLELKREIQVTSSEDVRFGTRGSKTLSSKYVFTLYPANKYYYYSDKQLQEIFNEKKYYKKYDHYENVCTWFYFSCQSYWAAYIDVKREDNKLRDLIQDDGFYVRPTNGREGVDYTVKDVDVKKIKVTSIRDGSVNIQDKKISNDSVKFAFDEITLTSPNNIEELTQFHDDIFDVWYKKLVTHLFKKYVSIQNIRDINNNLFNQEMFDLSYFKNLGKIKLDLDYVERMGNKLNSIQKNILQKTPWSELKNSGITNDGGKSFLFNGMLYVDKLHYDNYLNLCSTSSGCEFSELDLKVMYHSFSTPHEAVTNNDVDRSDSLYKSEKDAEEEMLRGTKTSYFRKKYILYDIFGNKASQGFSEEDVINKALTQVYIPYKFVNKREINEYPKRKFFEFVSEGTYNVYGVLYNGKYMYFKSYEKALNAYKKQFIKWDNYLMTTNVVNIYKYWTGKEYITFKYRNSEELNKIAEEIYYNYYEGRELK